MSYEFLWYIFLDVSVIIILLFSNLESRKIPIRQSRYFDGVVISQILFILADMLIEGVNYDGGRYFPAPVLWLANALFFLLFLLRSFFFFGFSVIVVTADDTCRKVMIRIGKILLVVMSALVVSSYWTKAVFLVDTNGYQRGWFGYIVYAESLILMLLPVICLQKNRRKLRKRLRITTEFYIALCELGVISRILFGHHLMMSVFGSLAIFIIFVTYEHPRYFKEGISDCFSEEAMVQTFEEWVGQREYWMYCFAIQNFSEMLEIYGRYQMDQAVRMISEFIKKSYPGHYYFYTNQRFAILSDKPMNFDFIRSSLTERFRKPWVNEEANVFLTLSQFAVHNYTNYENGMDLVQSLKIILERREDVTDELSTEITDEEFSIIDRSLQVKKRLNYVVRRDMAELFLQPIINAQTGRLVGAEALIRIRDEDGNLIYPSEFIPVAEKNGAIISLGTQIYERACRFLSQHQETLGLTWLNVNLSPIQCMDETLPDRFCEIAKKYQVPTSLITLEITEEADIDFHKLSVFMRQMMERGFTFSLDDYGSGYSNISRVKNLPFRNIKLDKEIVWDHLRYQTPLLPQVIHSFQQMGYSITAEGVENEEMADVLSLYGIDYFQGFYYSRPIPVDEFVGKYSK